MSKLLKFFVICVLNIFWINSLAAEIQYEDGKQYQKAPANISGNQLVQDFIKESKGKTQVIEFFSYGCHWCYNLDPYIEKWLKSKPDKVEFQRIPVEFQAAWGPLAKAYYTELTLNAFDKVHQPLFEAIQTEKITNSDQETLSKFFVSKGIDEKTFKQAFDSFNVTRKHQWANAISKAYRITAVPAIIVQGPKGIYVTSIRMAGSEENVIGVLDHLIKMQDQAISTKKESTKKK